MQTGRVLDVPADATGMSSTATELAKKLKIGLNIGNTLEAIGGETAWGNPVTTKKMIDDMSITAVVPVYEDNDHHPLRAKTVDENGRLQMYGGNIEKSISTNRQDLPKCFFLAHNIWVLNVKEMLKSNGKVGQQPWTFLGNNIDYYEIDESLDIHKEIDLYIAAEWVKENFKDYIQ